MYFLELDTFELSLGFFVAEGFLCVYRRYSTLSEWKRLLNHYHEYSVIYKTVLSQKRNKAIDPDIVSNSLLNQNDKNENVKIE